MIPFPIQAKPSDAIQGEASGVHPASRKKNVKNFASLFSSLLQKTKDSKDPAATLRGAAVAERGLAGRSIPASDKPGDGKVEKPVVGKKGPKAGLTANSADRDFADGRTVAAEHAASARSIQAQALPVKPNGAKDVVPQTKIDEAAAKDASPRTAETRKRDRARDPLDATVDSAAIAFSAAGNPQAKNAAKVDASSKGEERVEGVDSRKKDKRKERMEIEVFDKRSGETYGASSGALKATSALEPGDGASNGNADLVLTLREGNAETGADKSAVRESSSPKTSFADALAQELRETYNSDIVQRASVVLKDGGDGLVRLSLRPESLGSVKIRLELADNKIAGKILVETDEALKAFGKELRSLEQAFLDGGFDGASLELALSSGDSGAGSQRQDDSEFPQPFFSDRLVAGEYDSAVPAAEVRRPIGVREDALIDVLA